MINDLIDYFKNKKILILGFGREGQSTYRFLRNHLKEQKIYIADLKENFWENVELLKQDENVECICGPNYLDGLEKYDIIMKTPGIAFVGMDISSFKDKIKSELELLLEFFENKTIGITGTKGKSTTSSLIYKVLQDQNVKSIFLGNIGIPAFDYVEQIEKDTILVLEMSSHQLEFMKVSPNISILTNLFPEHLDHYNSYEDYALAKCNIFKHQAKEDYFLYNYDNNNLKSFVKELYVENEQSAVESSNTEKKQYVIEPKAKTYKASLEGNRDADILLKQDKIIIKENKKDKVVYDINEPRNLLGDYNLNNIMFVLGVSEILGLNIDETKKSIAEFKTLPHRLEFVGEVDGVKYYDNCIATIPDATIEAVKALKNVDTLIIGGMDRGVDYSTFAKYLDECDVTHIICMPKTGHDISKIIKTEKCYNVETLEEAVNLAKKITEKGKSCLISPAAASYGFFKNFEEKGDLFKKLVLG